MRDSRRATRTALLLVPMDLPVRELLGVEFEAMLINHVGLPLSEIKFMPFATFSLRHFF